MTSKLGNNRSQYYLLRGAPSRMVCMSDEGQAKGLDVGDAQQAAISQWMLSCGLAVSSRPAFMEALPSQQIRFQDASKSNAKNYTQLRPQSTVPFERFHLKK